MFHIFIFRNVRLKNCTTIRPLESHIREIFVYTLMPNVTDGILSLMAMNAAVLCQLIQLFTLTGVVELPRSTVSISLMAFVRIFVGARLALNSGYANAVALHWVTLTQDG